MGGLSPDSPAADFPPESQVAPSNQRLPCRGCLRDCINYPVCDGRPWRADTPAPT